MGSYRQRCIDVFQTPACSQVLENPNFSSRWWDEERVAERERDRLEALRLNLITPLTDKGYLKPLVSPMIGIFESGSPGILIEGDYRCQPIYLSQRLHDEPRTSSRAAVEKRVSLPQLFHQLLSVVAGRSRLHAPT